MKIGYSAWGFVGDGLQDSPDGGRLTRALFLQHLLLKGYDIVWLQENRDVENDQPIFSLNKISEQHSEQRKTLCSLQYDNEFPDIDILFLEWRWRLPGRNCDVDKNSSLYMPDLDRQTELLNHYKKEKVKIVIWDKDETLTVDDEKQFSESTIIFSPALYPHKLIFDRTTLLFPCDLEKVKRAKVNTEIDYVIGYVGSQYERDDQVYKYINPTAVYYSGSVIFAGNWTKYYEKAKRNKLNFPEIIFTDRILPKDMYTIYNNCLTSVLLCKKNYAEHGHITQRIHEVAENGVIGIGLREQKGIEKFILPENIITDAYDLISRIQTLIEMKIQERQNILDQQIEMLELFDIHNVIKVFEETINV